MRFAKISLCAAAAGLLSTTAIAAQLKPNQAEGLTLGEMSAVVFYVEQDGYFEVTTAVAPVEGNPGATMQFVSQLAPGQKYRFAVAAGDPAEPPYTLQIERLGGVLTASVLREALPEVVLVDPQN